MKVSELDKIIAETISNEIKNRILNESKGGKTAHCIKCEGEYVEVCESKEEADQKCEEYNKKNPNKDYVVEVETFESQKELIDKLDELGEEKDKGNMKKNQSIEEKLHGKQHELDVDKNGKIEASDLKDLRQGDTNEDFDISEIECEKCGKGLCECGSMKEESINETKNRRVLRLTEAQMIDMITKMVKESNVPGLKTVENVQKINKKETAEHMATVDKKIKDALTIEGGDNPEFPNANGKGDKKAIHNTEAENEEMSMDRGEAALDLDYDHEPSEEFKARVKKSLEGDSTMGNADGGNTIPTKTGKNLQAIAEKRKKYKKEAPMYVKDVQPIKELKEEVSKVNNVLEEEINKMKNMFSYNEKTQ